MKCRGPMRALRRSHTLRVALRRRAIHLRDAHPEYLHDPRPENVDCVCEVAPFYFARRTNGHRDSKKTPGQPKFGRGCCSHGLYRETARVRVQSHRLERAILSGRLDPDWVEPSVTSQGNLEQHPLRFARGNMWQDE